MDILSNKSYKDFDYTCRYSSIPYYYNTEDQKYIYGIGTQLKTNISYVAYKPLPTDNLDSLSLKYYGNPTYWWVIADFNRIQDPYVSLIDNFEILKIPNLSSITFGWER